MGVTFGSEQSYVAEPQRSKIDRVLVARPQLHSEFDASKLEAYPLDAVIILPGNTPHFHWAKSGEYVTQVTAMGPLGLEYLNAKDDPRNNNS